MTPFTTLPQTFDKYYISYLERQLLPIPSAAAPAAPRCEQDRARQELCPPCPGDVGHKATKNNLGL